MSNNSNPLAGQLNTASVAQHNCSLRQPHDLAHLAAWWAELGVTSCSLAEALAARPFCCLASLCLPARPLRPPLRWELLVAGVRPLLPPAAVTMAEPLYWQPAASAVFSGLCWHLSA